MVLALGIRDKGPEEIIPGTEDIHNGDDGEDRLGQGQDDLPVDVEVAGPIDARRLEEVFGQAIEVAFENEDGKDLTGGWVPE